MIGKSRPNEGSNPGPPLNTRSLYPLRCPCRAFSIRCIDMDTTSRTIGQESTRIAQWG